MDYLFNYLSGIDPSLRTLPESVYLIWQSVLFVVVVFIVPTAIFLLRRTLRGALNIKRYFGEMLTAGVAIAENTRSIVALDDTIAVAVTMIESSKQLDEHSATIAAVLSDRAIGGTTS